jgi:hypothetical protein
MLLSFLLGLAYIAALPILVVTMIGWRIAANFERWRVGRLLGIRIDAPYHPAAEGGLVERLRAQASDRATWRDLIYLLLLLPVGIAELAVVVVGFSLAIGLLVTPTAGGGIAIAGAHFNSRPASIALGVLGIPVLALVLNLFVLVGRLHALGARLLLGGDRS